MDKIHAPALVCALRLGNEPSMYAHVFASSYPHAYLQAFQAIPAIHPFLVHRPTLSSQHDVNAQVPEARPGMRNLTDPKPQR